MQGNKSFLKTLDLEGYLREEYQKTIKEIPYLNEESKHERRMRELFYLNIKWFMITQRILDDKSSPILGLVDMDAMQTLIETGVSSFKAPWFGQLMRGPQLLAYLIQPNEWLKEYKVSIEL